MKKFVSLFLAIMMIFALCACGGSDEDKSGTEDKSEGTTQMVNPMKEVTQTEFKESVGVELTAPEEAENVKTFTIDGKLGEMRFTYKGVEYSYRVEKTDGIEDISGVHLSDYASSASLIPSYSSSASLTPEVQQPAASSAASPASLQQEPDDDSVKISFDAEAGAGFVSWYADGYSYSLSVSEGATFDLLYEMYQILAA